jgi:dTDP-4-amino-4,6-dideoxygalactose transaminase
MLVINDDQFQKRAEIIWEKGTNRSAFFKGEVDKYGWVDIGSSFLPSDIIAAFLYAQLENLDRIQTRRMNIWKRYNSNLKHLETTGKIVLPFVPDYSTNNAHMFYIQTKSKADRPLLIDFLAKNDIHAVFHYVSLNKSPFYLSNNEKVDLINSDTYSDCLLRLPFYFELTDSEIDEITQKIDLFFTSSN